MNHRRAVAILNSLARGGFEPTAEEFASHGRVAVGEARVTLLRLFKFGLARRRKDRSAARTKPPYRYALTRRGQRLARRQGSDIDLADEAYQLEQLAPLEGLVRSGRLDEAWRYYYMRRNLWRDPFCREIARIWRMKIVTKIIRRE